MESWQFASPDPETTFALGRALGQAIGLEGLAIALDGPLGAGKTLFVKGLAEGLGLYAQAVSSPTFVIAQEYPLPEGPEVLHHVDLYRLESADELESIGFYDMLGRGSVVAVEWAGRFPGVLGASFLAIELAGPSLGEAATGESTNPAREGRVRASGELARQILGDWAGRVARLDGLDRDDAFDEAVEHSDSKRSSGAAVRGPQNRALLALILAAGLWALCSSEAVANRVLNALHTRSRGLSERSLVLGRVARHECDRWITVSRDGLGSRMIRCGDSDRRVSRAEGQGADERSDVTGVGLWLTGQKVDLNQASRALLEAIPGLGPVRAEAIVNARASARFSELADLERVPGIGPSTRQRVSRWVYVDSGSNAARGVQAGPRLRDAHEGEERGDG